MAFRLATNAEAIRSLGYTTAEARKDGMKCHTYNCNDLGSVYVTAQGDLVYYCEKDAARVEKLRQRRYGES